NTVEQANIEPAIGTLNATEAADSATFAAAVTPQQPQQPPEPQALADYARRVGAERRNFCRYVITETQRELYHHDRYIIRISRDGEVTVREAHGGAVPEEILPTPEEQAAIKAACASAAFPTAKSANQYDVEKLLKLVGRDAVLFKFRDPHNENFVTFVQQRIFRKEEAKTDLPWSFWSDGEWRCMEPDYEQLPLFGLEQLKQHWLMRVYVHEGAKTAWFLQQPDSIKAQWWREHSTAKGEWRYHCPWAKELAVSYSNREL